MTMRQYVTRTSGRTILAAAVLLGSAVAAGAQSTQVAAADGRWTPWVGCWQPSARDAVAELAPDKPAPIVCVVPASGNATVDLVRVNGSTVETPERVDANGSRRAINREGCTGWETAEFSADAKRIYLKSEHQCAGNRTRTSTGLMSISPNGEWLDVEGVKVDSRSAVRVVHYGRVPVPSVLSPEMRAALEPGSMATSLAVMAASDSVRVSDVVDATKHVEPLVVQTWLAQRGQGFGLDAKRLSELADANVPSNVIDVMVALSYPGAFAVNLAQADGQIVPTAGQAQVATVEGLRDGPTVYMDYDPFFSSYGYYSRNGLYPGYYPGYYGTYYQGRPVIIVTRPSGTVDVPAADNRGKMVRGKGYTRPPDRTDGGSGGSPRGSTSDGGSRSSGSSGSTGSSSGGGSSEPRTAKPRSP
jgi:uncharacterized membrane protein YgcG